MRCCRHPDRTCRNSYRPGISSFIGDRGTHVPLTDWSRVMASYAPEFLSLALIHFLAVVAPGPHFASTVLMNAARIIGALYICYLAVNLLRAQPAVAGDPSDIQGKAENQTNGQS